MANVPTLVRGSLREGSASSSRFASRLAKPEGARLLYALLSVVLVVVGIGVWLVYHYVLPEGGDLAGTVAFYQKYHTVGKAALAAFGVFSVPVLAAVGASAAYFWGIDTSKGHILSWIAIVSDIVFAVGLFIYVSLVTTPMLMYGRISDELLHVLHVQSLAAATMLGPLWIPNIVAIVLIGRRAGLFPTWLSWIAGVGVLSSFAALLGVTTLNGPFNAENGFVSLWIPTIGPLAWVFYLAAWWAVQWAKEKAAEESLAGCPA
ncbi:MAG: hypothetical protein ACRC20_03925 [Segniliparus sp.]|uniref:hypothetical protein n=1 Tax=Segniliparus sp. TaxID=2804064 RepID=UPI003F35C164